MLGAKRISDSEELVPWIQFGVAANVVGFSKGIPFFPKKTPLNVFEMPWDFFLEVGEMLGEMPFLTNHNVSLIRIVCPR